MSESESTPLSDTFLTFKDLEDQLGLAWNQLTSAQAEIRRLHEIKNARFVAASKLPPEVLALVFEILSIGEHQDFAIDYVQDLTQEWLPATQVCRQWRSVALHSPRIWSCVYDTAPLRWAELQLERSKSAPLFLRSANDHHVNDAVFNLVLGHATRLEALDIQDCTKEKLEEMLRHAPLPCLERLCLTFDGSFTEKYQLTSASFPRLLHLKIADCCFAHGPLLMNLHSLSIAWSEPQARLTTIELLTTLRQMSRLTSLELLDAIALPRHAPLNLPREPIPLPSLIHLFIDTDDLRTLEILKYLEITEPIVPFMYAMLPQRTIWRSLAQVTLQIGLSGSQSRVKVEIWTRSGEKEVQPAVENESLGEPSFRVKLRGVGDLRTELAVCRLVPGPNMSILEFSAQIQDSYHNLASRYALPFFRGLKDFEYLRVPTLDDLVLVLSDAPTKLKGSGAPGPYSLPSLRHIVAGDHGYYSLAERDKVISRLKRLLVARKEWGSAVVSLKISPPHYLVSMSTYDPIAEVVPIQF